MRDFRTLKVWQKSHELTCLVYASSRRFPNTENHGITSQLRRAAVSVSANIADGCGRGSDPDFARFAQIAMGSASEVQYLLLLARDLQYLKIDDYTTLDDRIAEVKRMLSSFLRKLRNGDVTHRASDS